MSPQNRLGRLLLGNSEYFSVAEVDSSCLTCIAYGSMTELAYALGNRFLRVLETISMDVCMNVYIHVHLGEREQASENIMQEIAGILRSFSTKFF